MIDVDRELYDLLVTIEDHEYDTPIPRCLALMRLAASRGWIEWGGRESPYPAIVTAAGRRYLADGGPYTRPGAREEIL